MQSIGQQQNRDHQVKPSPKTKIRQLKKVLRSLEDRCSSTSGGSSRRAPRSQDPPIDASLNENDLFATRRKASSDGSSNAVTKPLGFDMSSRTSMTADLSDSDYSFAVMTPTKRSPRRCAMVSPGATTPSNSHPGICRLPTISSLNNIAALPFANPETPGQESEEGTDIVEERVALSSHTQGRTRPSFAARRLAERLGSRYSTTSGARVSISTKRQSLNKTSVSPEGSPEGLKDADSASDHGELEDVATPFGVSTSFSRRSSPALDRPAPLIDLYMSDSEAEDEWEDEQEDEREDEDELEVGIDHHHASFQDVFMDEPETENEEDELEDLPCTCSQETTASEPPRRPPSRSGVLCRQERHHQPASCHALGCPKRRLPTRQSGVLCRGSGHHKKKTGNSADLSPKARTAQSVVPSGVMRTPPSRQSGVLSRVRPIAQSPNTRALATRETPKRAGQQAPKRNTPTRQSGVLRRVGRPPSLSPLANRRAAGAAAAGEPPKRRVLPTRQSGILSPKRATPQASSNTRRESIRNMSLLAGVGGCQQAETTNFKRRDSVHNLSLLLKGGLKAGSSGDPPKRESVRNMNVLVGTSPMRHGARRSVLGSRLIPQPLIDMEMSDSEDEMEISGGRSSVRRVSIQNMGLLRRDDSNRKLSGNQQPQVWPLIHLPMSDSTLEDDDSDLEEGDDEASQSSGFSSSSDSDSFLYFDTNVLPQPPFKGDCEGPLPSLRVPLRSLDMYSRPVGRQPSFGRQCTAA